MKHVPGLATLMLLDPLNARRAFKRQNDGGVSILSSPVLLSVVPKSGQVAIIKPFLSQSRSWYSAPISKSECGVCGVGLVVSHEPKPTITV